MYKYNLTICLVVFLAVIAWGQEVFLPPPLPASALPTIGNHIASGEPRVHINSIEVRGTAYLFQDWPEGKVLLRDGRVISGEASFNIDGTENRGIVVKLPNGNVIDIYEELVDELHLSFNGELRKFKPFPSEPPSGKLNDLWIGEILYTDGTTSFIKHHLKTLSVAEKTTPYASDKRYHEYLDEIQYFLQINGSLSKIKLSRKSIASVDPVLASKLREKITEDSVIQALSEE